MAAEHAREALEAAIARLPGAPSDERCGSLALQAAVFSEFARRMALGADVEGEALLRHVAEAIWAAPAFRGPRVLDVGSGAGYPAVAVAILRPELQVELCERRGKTAAFLEYLLSRLALSNATVAATDVAVLLASGGGPWDTISARAIPEPERWIARLARHVAADGRIIFFSTLERLEGLSRAARGAQLHVSVQRDLNSRQRVLVIGERNTS